MEDGTPMPSKPGVGYGGTDKPEDSMPLGKSTLGDQVPRLVPETKVSGGRVNYYLVHVDYPQREDRAPYQAECEDIIEALELNPDEANIFKEIWRSANQRKNNGKPGHSAVYGAEKIVHYAGRILRRLKRLPPPADPR